MIFERDFNPFMKGKNLVKLDKRVSENKLASLGYKLGNERGWSYTIKEEKFLPDIIDQLTLEFQTLDKSSESEKSKTLHLSQGKHIRANIIRRKASCLGIISPTSHTDYVQMFNGAAILKSAGFPVLSPFGMMKRGGFFQPLEHVILYEIDDRFSPLDATEFENFTGAFSSKFVGMELWNKSDLFERYYYNSGYAPDVTERSGYFDEALLEGWSIGAAGSEDNHTATWGLSNNRLAVLAGTNTRASIYDALQARRFYSTLDKNLELSFTVEGLEMGNSVTGGLSTCEVRAADGDGEGFIYMGHYNFLAFYKPICL